MCFRCTNNYYEESTNPFTLDYDGKLIVVRDVPSKKCAICDETYFTDDTLQVLENIVNQAKKANQAVSIIEYSSKAA